MEFNVCASDLLGFGQDKLRKSENRRKIIRNIPWICRAGGGRLENPISFVFQSFIEQRSREGVMASGPETVEPRRPDSPEPRHRWRFFRAGGFAQVRIETGEDRKSTRLNSSH